jgi:F-type H+-transporting ATPase subunit b
MTDTDLTTAVALAALIAFIILLLVVRAPAQLAGALDTRREAIAKELADARRLREEAEKLLAEHQERKIAAEAMAAELIEGAKLQARLLAEETREQMTKAIAQREKQAEERIAQAEAHATAQVRAAAADAALAAAEKMLREQIDAGGQSALVAEGVAQLGRKFA